MKKLISIFVCTLFLVSINVIAGNNDDPEIKDVAGDAFGYLDIDSVWFYEEVDNPGFLFVAMKINEPSYYKFQQTFAIFWKYENKQYACGLHLGFDTKEDWEQYSAGEYNNMAPRGGPKNYNVNGTYSVDEGVIIWDIPKEYIGSPEKDDVLTNTWSNAFRRLGFLGRIGFTRIILDSIVYRIFGNSLWDHAPDKYGEYGRDYIIKY
jgi:hypothetical protein